MQDPTKPKVLYPLAEKPLVSYVLELCEGLGCDRTVAIIGYGRDKVEHYLKQNHPASEIAIQDKQLGTGHAVQQAESVLEGFNGDILVLSGDVPLLRIATARSLIAQHQSSGALATVLSVDMENPFGYGRIVRTMDRKHLERIVEEKDATDEIRKVTEINSGIYVFDAKTLFLLLGGLQNNNAQGEFYLTDVFGEIVRTLGSSKVSVFKGDDPIEVAGVNTKDQLTALETEYLRRQANAVEA